MNDNLPAHLEVSLAEIGTISYANEVIAIIAGMAASEIDGVAAMGATPSIADILGRNRKPITKGVKVEVGSEEASVDLTFSVEYGKPIQRVCRDVQESVRKAIETMTGLHVVKVDVHVLGVSFERETQQLAESAQVANLSLDAGKRGQPVREKKKDVEEAKPEARPQEAQPVSVPSESPAASGDVDAPEEAPGGASAEAPIISEEPETANKLPPDAESGAPEATFVSAIPFDVAELVEDDTLEIESSDDEKTIDPELDILTDIDLDGDDGQEGADGGEGSAKA